MKDIISRIKWIDTIIVLICLVFSSVIMWKTFQVNSQGNIEIATKAWSDFAATIPLARSFSFGNNFPPQYPIFAGPHIRYHFLFYLIVGWLEKVGLRLDFALNILSTLSFTGLMVIVYFTGKHIFKSRAIGLIAAVLLIFNGSLGFLEFFKIHPLSGDIIQTIINNNKFSSFGPYDGKVVSAFWNLNIYTNQRHLALAYAVFIGIFGFLYQHSGKPKQFGFAQSIIIGVIIGVFPFLHLAVFGMLGLMLFTCLLIFPKIRLKIMTVGITALIIGIPQLIYIGRSQISTPLIHLGYLAENTALLKIVEYWFLNLGLVLFIAPLGFLLSTRKQKIFIVPFLLLFAIGNCLQFSPEIAANHKFFNLFLIGLNFYSSLFLVKLWRKNLFSKLPVFFLLILLTLTGIIDFFPIINDHRITVNDLTQDETAAFIYNHSPKNATFLNSSYLYHPANIAGRKIYLGWPYFAWSAGYNTEKRSMQVENFYSGYLDPALLCKKLAAENIDYIEVQTPASLENVKINYQYFADNFVMVFENANQSFKIYDVQKSCKSF